MHSIMRWINWCKESTWFLFKKLCNLQYAITDFFEKQLCVSFTPIDLSHYSPHRSIKVTVTKTWISYKIFYILSKCVKIMCELSRKLLIFRQHYLNTFVCKIIRRIILCKENYIPLKRNGDSLHTILKDRFFR